MRCERTKRFGRLASEYPANRLEPVLRKARVQRRKWLIIRKHVVNPARKHHVMQGNPDVIGDNPLVIRLAARLISQQHVGHFHKLVIELRVVAKGRDVTLVIADDPVERKVTGHEAAGMNGDEEGPWGKRLWPAELARRRRHAADQNLTGTREALNVISDMELDVLKHLETLRELIRLVFVPEKPDLELVIREERGNTGKGRHRRVAEAHKAQTSKAENRQVPNRVSGNRSRSHGGDLVTIHKGKALATQGVIEENLGGKRGHPAGVTRYDLNALSPLTNPHLLGSTFPTDSHKAPFRNSIG